MSDYQLNVLRAGAGAPPLVFVHGLLCRLQDWHYQLDHFAAAHRVLACDLRGHGQSPRGDAPMDMETLGADVAALLESEDLTGAVLIGHSMGCRVVMAARQRVPARVAGLVLVDGSRVGTDGANVTAAIASLDASVAERGFAAIVAGLFEAMFFGDPPDWKAEKMAQVLAMPETVGLALLRAMTAWDGERLDSVLADLDIPLLVVQSTAMGPDRVRRALNEGEVSAYQQLLLDKVAGAQSETLAGHGHFNMMEAPDAVNTRIEQFIAAL